MTGWCRDEGQERKEGEEGGSDTTGCKGCASCMQPEESTHCGLSLHSCAELQLTPIELPGCCCCCCCWAARDRPGPAAAAALMCLSRGLGVRGQKLLLSSHPGAPFPALTCAGERAAQPWAAHLPVQVHAGIQGLVIRVQNSNAAGVAVLICKQMCSVCRWCLGVHGRVLCTHSGSRSCFDTVRMYVPTC